MQKKTAWATELPTLRAELAIAEGNKEGARKKVQAAKKWINDKGMQRWEVEVERLQSELE
jgi:hypothetical protein